MDLEGAGIEGGYFNPRTREGCDLGWLVEKLYAEKFQSTHP